MSTGVTITGVASAGVTCAGVTSAGVTIAGVTSSAVSCSGPISASGIGVGHIRDGEGSASPVSTATNIAWVTSAETINARRLVIYELIRVGANSAWITSADFTIARCFNDEAIWAVYYRRTTIGRKKKTNKYITNNYTFLIYYDNSQSILT